MLNINQLLTSGNNALLVVSASDLLAFANDVFSRGAASTRPIRREPYTREEAARFLHVSPQTIDRWRHDGLFGPELAKERRERTTKRILIPAEKVEILQH